jgi:integrase
MTITRHHSGRWLFQFNRVIPGAGRQRANRLLPQGWTRAQAQAYDQREVARLYELASGGQQPQPLIEDAVLLYLEDHAPGGKHPLKNHEDTQGALALLHPFYAGRRMDELGDVVDDYMKGAQTVSKDGKPKKLARATIRNRLAYLRSACRYYWKTVLKKKGQNPGDLMDLPTVNNARHVYLTRAQAVAVFRKMGLSWSRDAARVAFYTGWRISEVLEATPVETPSGLALSIPDTKNGLPRMVPVHDKIIHLVRRHWPLQVTQWTVSKAVKKALRAVGLGHARLHDLRHSAASEMINQRVDLYTVGGVLGHKSAVSTARYAHLAQERLREAVGKIGGKRLQPGPEAKAA